MVDKSKKYTLVDVPKGGLTANFEVTTYIKTYPKTLTLDECKALATNFVGMTMLDKDNAEQAELALAQMGVPAASV
jgi:hypothetical protein